MVRVYKKTLKHSIIILSLDFTMKTIRTTYILGKYVTLEIKDDGNQNIDLVLSQNIHINNILTKTDYTLTLQRWQHFMYYVDEIQQAVQELNEGKEVYLNYHMGGNNFVQVNSGFNVVDFRQFWLPYGQSEVHPTRKGIALKFDEFETLIQLKANIEQVIPELNETQPCWMADYHKNPLGYLMCPECNPDDYMNW